MKLDIVKATPSNYWISNQIC